MNEDEEFFDEYDDEGAPRSGLRRILMVVVVVAVAIGGWFVVRPALGGDDDDDGDDATAVVDETIGTQPSTTEGDPIEDLLESDTTAVSTSAPAVTLAPPPTDPVDTAPTGTATGSSVSAGGADADGSTETTDVTGTTTDVSASTEAPSPTSTPPAGNDGSTTYDTLPDGTPAPVIAVFGEDRITITGEVPSEAAKERLEALAIANAKPGQADTIANFVTINPDVPIGVGVRVVELTSVRFPESSAEILPAHAQELNRAAAIMNALPHISVDIIGHADQRGDLRSNYALSEERAESVLLYLVTQGVLPDRMTSRAVGASDLLTLNDDAAALALNRRTEFVFYGLLIPQDQES